MTTLWDADEISSKTLEKTRVRFILVDFWGENLVNMTIKGIVHKKNEEKKSRYKLVLVTSDYFMKA